MKSPRFWIGSAILLGCALAVATGWLWWQPAEEHEFPRLSQRAAKARVWGVIVDARPASAHQAGAIPGSVNIPATWQGRVFESQLEHIRAGSPKGILIYCGKPPCADSLNLARRLKKAGVDNIFILRDGYTGSW